MDPADHEHILSAIHLLAGRGRAATPESIVSTEFFTTWDIDQPTLDAALDALIASDHVARSDDAFVLTADGRRRVQQTVARGFGDWMLACEGSTAYRKLCAKVYGAERCQFDMLTQPQLATLLHALGMAPGQHVLDLGCGTGALTEYVATVTGAHVTGIDFSPQAITFAQQHRGATPDRLTFQVMDMDDLHLPPQYFDVVLAVDTLYFVADLRTTIDALAASLKTGGHMGLFYSATVDEGQSVDDLAPMTTALAKVLTASGLRFETWEFTADEQAQWERSLQTANELRTEFEAEGNVAIYEGHIAEATSVLERCYAGRSRRYFYRVRQE